MSLRNKDTRDLADGNFVINSYRNMAKQFQRIHKNKFYYSDGGNDFPAFVHNGTGSSHAYANSGTVPSSLSFGAGTSAAINKENTNGTATDTGVFSCSIYAKAQTGVAYMALAAKWHNITTGGASNLITAREWLFYLHDDRVAFNLQDETNGGHQGVRATSQHSSIGKWTHYAVTYDGRGGANARNGIKLYVNGTEITAVTDNSGFETNTGSYSRTTDTMAPLYIGIAPTNPNGTALTKWKGYMTDVAIWNKKLSAANIKSLYNSRHASVGLLHPWGWWRMGDGTNPNAIGTDAAKSLNDSINGSGIDINANRVFDQSGNDYHMYGKQGFRAETLPSHAGLKVIKEIFGEVGWRVINFGENGTGGAIADSSSPAPLFRGVIRGAPALRFGGTYKLQR